MLKLKILKSLQIFSHSSPTTSFNLIYLSFIYFRYFSIDMIHYDTRFYETLFVLFYVLIFSNASLKLEVLKTIPFENPTCIQCNSLTSCYVHTSFSFN
jgi:hypothetical protein